MRNRSELIEGVVGKVRDVLGIGYGERVVVSDVIEQLGGRVNFYSGTGSNLGDRIEGYGDRIEALGDRFEEGFVVYVSDLVGSDLNSRLGYLLGHVMLHMGFLMDEGLWAEVRVYEATSFGKVSYEADRFEAELFMQELLMPVEEFLDVRDRLSGRLLDSVYEELAIYFGVSYDMVVRRDQVIIGY